MRNPQDLTPQKTYPGWY